MMYKHDDVKSTVKQSYHHLKDCYECLYDLIDLEIVNFHKADCIQKHIRDVMVYIDDFILVNELK